jgi:hypothetical protein
LAGLDVFDGTPAKSTEADVEAFLDRVANSFGQKRIALIEAEGEVVHEDRPHVIVQLKEALEDAAEETRLDGRNDILQERPKKLLIEAAKYVRRAGEAYEKVGKNVGFDRASFGAARRDLNSAIEAVDAMIAADELK